LSSTAKSRQEARGKPVAPSDTVGRVTQLRAATEADRAVPNPSAIAALSRGFAGELVLPTHPAYEEQRRIWNGSIDRFPALIARCASVADVIAAVKFARETSLLVAVRGGGHSFPGFSVCDGGIVIDLGLMTKIEVNVANRRVVAQAGIRLGDLDAATQPFGLAVPAGIVTHTGLAGLTLGGGIGWLMRKYGLTIDQLLAVDVVTADGSFVSASEAENPDLFWGVRGGGGNFGIVTRFEFRLNPVGPMVLAGPIFWPMADSASVMRFYREWIADAPDDLTTIIVHRMAPALPYVPPELHGRPVIAVTVCWAGSIEDGERFVRPMRRFGRPVLDLCQPKPFVEHQAMFDPSLPSGWWYYFRSCDVETLTDEIIDITAQHSLAMRSPINTFPIFQLGGAVARVGDDETVFSARRAGHTFNINATTATAEGFDEERAWSRGLWEALKPHHTSVYVNFLMDEGEDRIRQAYGPAKYDRLKALKEKYDPDNFFRLNQNIRPV
jgi:FAD/FMN-containing dehydrogenase